jgi:molybdopterin synthase catalytic subunit
MFAGELCGRPRIFVAQPTPQWQMVAITDRPIDVGQVLAAVQHGQAGGINLFVGTVRNHAGPRAVIRLEYEAYGPMAERKLREIAEVARERWQLVGYAVVHRTGVLAVGEVAVAIAVSAPHRQATFEACQFMIDTIKQTVPIWKKEVYEDGQSWVAAHP